MQANEKSLSQQFKQYLKISLGTKFNERSWFEHSNLDGQYNGILFEFKKNKKKNNWKADALKECIKNASHLRLLAKDVPAKFAIVPLEEKEMYIYDSIDFFEEIHKIYSTSASNTNNEIDKIELGKRTPEKELIDYKDGFEQVAEFLKIKKIHLSIWLWIINCRIIYCKKLYSNINFHTYWINFLFTKEH